MKLIKVQAHLIATDKADLTTIIKDIRHSSKGELKINANPRFNEEVAEYGGVPETNFIPQHLYLTSDEEIKKGNWIIYSPFGVPGRLFKVVRIDQNACIILTDLKQETAILIIHCEKILATTNPELWYHDAPDIGKAGYNQEDFIPTIAKIDPKDIETYIKAYNIGNPIKELLLEIEMGGINRYVGGDEIKEHLQRRLKGEETQIKTFDTLKLTPSGCVITRPIEEMEEKKYTREEMKHMAGMIRLWTEGKFGRDTEFDEWFDKSYPE